VTVTMSVSGFAELDKELERLSQSVGKQVLNRALMKVAEPLAERAKSYAVGFKDSTGTLQNSITVGKKLNKRQSKMHRKAYKDDRMSAEVFVGVSYSRGSGARHAHLIEFGTGPRFHKKTGKYVGQVSPMPFMRPAWAVESRTMLDRLKVDLWMEIQKAIGRAERKAARQARR
jgi:HK97 gp10 family phage protein